jgi:hypothetical protein
MTATDGGSATGSDARGRPGGDTVAAVVRQWRAVHPDLDTGPMEIIGRINRCAALLQQAEDAPLRRAGLSRAEFDLLGALRRTGHELTPGDLARETFSSGAAVTKRLKQLTEPATAGSPTSASRTPAATSSTASCPNSSPTSPPSCPASTDPTRRSWRRSWGRCWPGSRAVRRRCGSEAPSGTAGSASRTAEPSRQP